MLAGEHDGRVTNEEGGRGQGGLGVGVVSVEEVGALLYFEELDAAVGGGSTKKFSFCWVS